jgi:class 3 adenylate cyclase
MPAPPTGTVTFLFTDIEGSTRLLYALGKRYRAVQDRHGEILQAAIDANDGHVVRTEGDSFFATFRTSIDAVRAAVNAQRNLSGNDWPEGIELRVRMGLHTGQGVLGGDDYIGIESTRPPGSLAWRTESRYFSPRRPEPLFSIICPTESRCVTWGTTG